MQVRRADFRSDFSHDFEDLASIFSARGEETHGFGQRFDQNDRNDERQYASEIENGAPAPKRNHHGTSQTANESTEGHTAEKCADEDGLQTLGRIFRSKG